ncbi:MAG: hypothetical protein J6S67_15005 [Methanobrevibacter sp.]|nr:hypothetical protein [Methanobrevibacter sp.]
MRYIICYKLDRKNARRKEYKRFNMQFDEQAKHEFFYQIKDKKEELSKGSFELLTGDWKHLAYFTKEGYNGNATIDKYKGGDKILELYFGMSKSMQKAIKDIMLVVNGKETEDERETTM